MKKLWIIVLSALGMGFITGVFLYVMNTDNQKQPVLPEKFSFEIVGEQYGGCLLNSQCASFRIVSDGGYTYVSGAKKFDKENLFKGKISKASLKSLQVILENFNPNNIQESNSNYCESYVDGVDYEYSITNGKDYFLIDTCDNSGTETVELFIELSNFWDEFKSIHEK